MKKSAKKDGAKGEKPKKRVSAFAKNLGRRKSIKADMEEEMDPTKVLLKPDDQLELTVDELKAEHTRILSARNPHAPDNLVTFDFNKYIFMPGPNIQHMETNYKRSVSGFCQSMIEKSFMLSGHTNPPRNRRSSCPNETRRNGRERARRKCIKNIRTSRVKLPSSVGECAKLTDISGNGR